MKIDGMSAMTPAQRLTAIQQARGLDQDALVALGDAPALPIALADGMIENVTGTFELPLGVATNFMVNGREVLVPMAVEEPSVVAAASFMAKLARAGRYRSLTKWAIDEDTLLGEITLPMAIGLVGGATKTHPAAQAALKLMNVETASELAGVIAAVGLAQNMAALRALSTEGIQRGHMALHARNLAIAAGATGDQIDRVSNAIVTAGDVTADAARKAMEA